MRKFLGPAITLLLAASAYAATLTGTVTNATTGKPSSGDQVELLALAQGMSVVGQTKSGANGAFSFELDNPNIPHLVRVTHTGVTYFPTGGPVRPGQNTVDIPVYDSAAKVEGVATNVNVLRVQADNTKLQALLLIAVQNQSKPPRTQSAKYEFYLPQGATIDQALVQGPGGMPVNTQATPDGNGGKYQLDYAIKPGETRFEISYHMPYAGDATFAPKITGNIQHFVVMMPKSMQFEAKNAQRFAPMDDSNAAIQVATQVQPGTDLAFRVSGTGQLQDEQRGGAEQAQSGGGMGATQDNRPGGGLGPPTDAPDPLHNHRYFILGGLAIVLIAGGVFVVNRSKQQSPTVAMPPPAPAKIAAAVAAPASAAPAVRPAADDRTGMLLEALKEELFQLEIERQQGKISVEEYEKSKAALTQTLSRALARQNNA